MATVEGIAGALNRRATIRTRDHVGAYIEGAVRVGGRVGSIGQAIPQLALGIITNELLNRCKVTYFSTR